MTSTDPGHETPAPPADAVLRAVWSGAGLPVEALRHVRLSGGDPVVASSYRIATALQSALGAAALAAAEVGRLRGLPMQCVVVDAADVVRECTGRFTVDGHAPHVWDKLAGLYRAAGGREWVRLHTNFEHHRDAALRLLGLAPGPSATREAVARALLEWSAEAFETGCAEQGGVAAAVRTPAQWLAHPQCGAVALQPLLALERIGDAPPLPWPRTTPSMPLRGVRVLDLSRILAGPIGGRTLAAYGADVMLVNSPRLPNIEAIADTSRGKLSVHIDLAEEAGRESLRALVRDADVFLDAYRPGSLAARGFSPEGVATLRPGIVCLSLTAYGASGPWAGRRGFDSLVQSATGMNASEAKALGQDEPRALPLQALDYGAGFLLAFGALAALMRQRTEGGSWRVSVSLAGVGRWLGSLGSISGGSACPPLDFDGAMEITDSGFGRLVAVKHAARFSGTPAAWLRPSMPPGTHAPAWPAL